MARPFATAGDPPLDQVDVADEARDVAVGRVLVDLARRADLRDPALVHDRDAARERHRLVLVVGHDDEGRAELVLQVRQLELRVLAQLLVERRERLVEQQQLRALDQRARERDALLLAARELVGLALRERPELHQRQHLRDALADLRRRHALLLQPVGDVLLDRHVREQRVGLEHQVDRPLVGRHVGHVDAVDEDPPDVGCSKPASIRSSVVLPQPEPPRIANSSPFRMSSDTPSTAVTPSKRLVTLAYLDQRRCLGFVHRPVFTRDQSRERRRSLIGSWRTPL